MQYAGAEPTSSMCLYKCMRNKRPIIANNNGQKGGEQANIWIACRRKKEDVNKTENII